MNNRILYLDVLRIFATLGVIIIHAACGHWYDVSYNSYEWNVLNLWDGLVRWAVPIFVMLSGTTLLDPKKNISVRQIYSKYIFRIIVAFIVWSFIYAFYFSRNSISEFIKGFFIGPLHLWFLFMICGMYMMLPILRQVVMNEIVLKYFLFLSIIFNFVISFLMDIIRIWTPKGKIGYIADIISVDYNAMSLQLIMGWSSYFVLGYFMRRKFNKKVSKYIKIIGLLGILSTIFLTWVIAQINNEQNAIFYSNFSPTVLLATVGIFEITKDISFEKIGDKMKKVITLVSQYSFGIYLSHYVILKVLTNSIMPEGNLSFNPILSIPFITVVTIILSFIVTAIIKQIPIMNKYIV